VPGFRAFLHPSVAFADFVSFVDSVFLFF
jgi:hypothetical protein